MADNAARHRTVLIFAYHFPPEPEIGAARPYRFYKYLSRMGYRCKVITAVPQDTSSSQDILYVPDPFITAPRGGLEWQTERAIRKIFYPGAVGIAWSHYAAQAARKVIKNTPRSQITVISTFPPLGVHLAAWRLARSENLPWIADFRDPMAYVPSTERTAFQEMSCRWFERRVVRAANAVIANTDICQENWQRQNPDRRNKIHLLWNGFDPEKRIAAAPLPPRKYKVLMHTGSLYAGRTVGPIIESLNRLIQKQILSPNTCHLRLVGAAEPGTLGDMAVVAHAQKEGWLELTSNAVPLSEALELMQASDYLLIIQQQSDIQVPGKLFEYIQTGRPILAFVMPNSPTERILAASGIDYRCIYSTDTPERMDQVITEFLKLPTESKSPSSWFEERFNGEVQARALAAIIDGTRS